MQSSSVSQQLIVQIIGYKNTGKTTLVCRLTERFKQAGYTVGTIKRDAHHFQIDKPGTDTWKHQAAGADITAITSSKSTAIMKAYSESLEQLIAQMPEADVVLVEGFKDADYPKIIMIRSEADHELFKIAKNKIVAALWPEASLPALTGESIHGIAVDQIEELFQTLITIPKYLKS
ncbi:molybdopterin-guanine dinucleotide biosynthesis protein B [Paenibacillus sp. FJAT-27812]|uniref:molybdopterin-guanine dinucleotide biosynthesis protein B n=1 Tax=Paenibacillus sp. FJAT-27812 TaxID=1684143 RepID=UPI0006A7B083|nr:molybdopterin-guanine dinucleotide biosynthesis protein B [Paenibacillus sp. FJAT-27812]